jgi:hypothetical protein
MNPARPQIGQGARPTGSNNDLAEAVGLVNSAKQRADAGGEIDLKDLPERIECICRLLAGMAPKEASGYLGVVENLIADLGTLQEKLGAQKRAMRRRLQEIDPQNPKRGKKIQGEPN